MQANKELKLALVGCGGIAQFHWEGIRNFAPRTRVVAAIDSHLPSAERMAAQTGARAFASQEAALGQVDFDAVDIMLPHHLHESVALAAFAAGKHVCMEKPMSTDMESCERILAAAKKSDKVFMIAEQAQFWADALLIQQLLRDGAIGEVITARAIYSEPAPKLPPGAQKPWRYFLAQAGGGPTADGGLHWLRPLRMWLGDIDEVVAVTARVNDDMESESLTRALLRFKSGAVATFDTMVFGDFFGRGEEFRITGTRGEILVEQGWHGRVLLFDAAHPEGQPIHEKYAGRRAAFGHELREFECAVLDGAPFAASPEYSLGDLRAVWAMYRSAKSRQWEKV